MKMQHFNAGSETKLILNIHPFVNQKKACPVISLH